MEHTYEEKLAAFGRLLRVLDELREKCPWDRKQTNESLRPNTIEETYELCDALAKDDALNICKELGDVLLHIAFYAKIGSEQGRFDIADVCNKLCDKLIFRHPHVFPPEGEEMQAAAQAVKTADQVSEQWEKIKQREREGNGSVLGGVPTALPTLIKGCRRVTEYAAEKGISTMVENHGYFAQDSDRVEKLVTGVANPNFGLLVDMGNFACADDPSDKAVGRVAKYAKHVHAKDFHIKSGSEPDPGRGFFRSRAGNYLRGAVIGHGNIPVAQCIGILKRAGYDKYVSIEFEGIEQTLTGIEIGLENLKRFIAMAE